MSLTEPVGRVIPRNAHMGPADILRSGDCRHCGTHQGVYLDRFERRICEHEAPGSTNVCPGSGEAPS